MTLRRITATALAALLLTGFAAAASAQTMHHGSTRHHTAKPHHARTQHHAARTHRGARGAMDSGPTSSDRGAADDLNARSLEQARMGQ